jgi:hypothetical protein
LGDQCWQNDRKRDEAIVFTDELCVYSFVPYHVLQLKVVLQSGTYDDLGRTVTVAYLFNSLKHYAVLSASHSTAISWLLSIVTGNVLLLPVCSVNSEVLIGRMLYFSGPVWTQNTCIMMTSLFRKKTPKNVQLHPDRVNSSDQTCVTQVHDEIQWCLAAIASRMELRKDFEQCESLCFQWKLR